MVIVLISLVECSFFVEDLSLCNIMIGVNVDSNVNVDVVVEVGIKVLEFMIGKFVCFYLFLCCV